jgi:hypothetical protein
MQHCVACVSLLTLLFTDVEWCECQVSHTAHSTYFLWCAAVLPAVGGVIGFALVFGGADAVTWYEPSSEFPFVKGIVPIIISWFLSPLMAALITLVLFLLVRTLVLRRPNSTKIAFWVLPILMILTFFINLFFILVSAAVAYSAGALQCGVGLTWNKHSSIIVGRCATKQLQLRYRDRLLLSCDHAVLDIEGAIKECTRGMLGQQAVTVEPCRLMTHK